MFSGLDNLKDVKKIRSWMYKIANTKILRYRMQKRRKAAISASVFYKDLFAGHTESKEEDGLRQLLRQELSKAVMTAMCELEDKFRTVLTLRFFEQLNYADIADAMRCSEVGARMLFLRAMRAVKKRFIAQGLHTETTDSSVSLFGRLTESTYKASSDNLDRTMHDLKDTLDRSKSTLD